MWARGAVDTGEGLDRGANVEEHALKDTHKQGEKHMSDMR